jgi:hypothetical protein
VTGTENFAKRNGFSVCIHAASVKVNEEKQKALVDACHKFWTGKRYIKEDEEN